VASPWSSNDQDRLAHRDAVGDRLRSLVRPRGSLLEAAGALLHAVDARGLPLLVGVQTTFSTRSLGLELAHGDVGGMSHGGEDLVGMALGPLEKGFRARASRARLDRPFDAVVERREIGRQAREDLVVRLHAASDARARGCLAPALAVRLLGDPQVLLELPLGGKGRT
jgi:hypothetical protein